VRLWVTGVDGNELPIENGFMNAINQSKIPADLMAELQLAAERAAHGIRSTEEMRQACEHMDRLAEEVRRQHGILDIGVPAIRQLRDSE